MITVCSTTDIYPSHIQYAKALLFNDQQTAESIELASTPKEAQELGNRVENFNQEQWNKEKTTITQQLVFLKFENNSTLRSILLGTGDVPIVEASPDSPRIVRRGRVKDETGLLKAWLKSIDIKRKARKDLTQWPGPTGCVSGTYFIKKNSNFLG
jgi:predicted NAD-dependent protein-ADP-ribosyltransferase YbiA (DUF1768 family)